MESFRAHEVCRVATIWRDIHRQPWLLVAGFAEIEGRIECVGMELRSYIRHREATVVETELSPPDAEASVDYDAYWAGGPVAAAHTSSDEELNWQLALLELPWHELVRHDLLAVEAQAQEAEGMDHPHLLRTETLRDLPLGRELEKLRTQLARQTGRLSETLLDLHLGVEREAGNTAAVDELEQWQRSLNEARSAIRSTPKGPGRPAKYDQMTLKEVAKIYADAYRTGSTSPTKDVQKALKLRSRSIAAKLVMKCRTEGLLEAVEPRKPGGIKTPDSPASSPGADGTRKSETQ